MAVKVRIPAPLRKLTKDLAVVESQGTTIEEIIVDLEKKYPGLKERICDESGQVRRFINIFLNGEDIRFKEGTKTKISGEAEVSIIPAIAGGCVVKVIPTVSGWELCPSHARRQVREPTGASDLP